MQDKYEDRREQVIDRYLQASYGLWNALLTVNGLILAAATLVSSGDVSLIKFAVVILALLSIGLLTYNYVSVKKTYFRIGTVMVSDPDKLTDEQKERDIKKSLLQYKLSKYAENSCLAILVVQAALLAVSLGCEIA
ncbi:hypothetical protein [Halospina sp. K52047b]|uniref:hypothetical protein n=1 Tax=Halospina sp. K52047b TaxID=2614160 RepID=UPI00124ACB56|nr:hypothetical protein [Halospina sp. K52047b]KAA8981344.1 hypothetical protein F3089_10610 [Halospina sp. K52047b]